ncbi:MAG: hypothetical protein WKG07_09495 [Hymenobacter sp.]
MTRRFGTPAFLQGRDLVQGWFNSGRCLTTRLDGIGQPSARAAGSARGRGPKTFVLASHIDTVVNAGKYDGPLGALDGAGFSGKIVASQQSCYSRSIWELIAFQRRGGRALPYHRLPGAARR